jgi:four helix bundle suffix protein
MNKKDTANQDPLIPKHGGYRNLKTFQLAEVIYDVTVRFCEKFLDPRSRTVDQMTQAGRSGRQNIAEGSMDSATSRKLELKLTGAAKGSLEELRLDYEDYLRQRGFPKWGREHPALIRFKERRCASLEDFSAWVAEEVRRRDGDTEPHGRTRTSTDKMLSHSLRGGPCPSVFVANGALSLINLSVYLLDRQLKAQAKAFEKNGGFTERLYQKRIQRREQKRD